MKVNKTSKAKIAANNRYNQKNYDKLNLKERSNNSNDSFEFEILENKMDSNDF